MTRRRYLESTAASGKGGQRILLDRLPLTIGRQSSCGVRLPSSQLSREHARIEDLQGVIAVRDLGSTNGTYVNYVRVDGPTAISHGDVLQFADFECRLIEEISAEQRTDTGPGEGTVTPTQRYVVPTESLAELMAQAAVTVLGQRIVDRGGALAGLELLGRSAHPQLDVGPKELFALAAKMDREVALSRLFRDVGVAQAAARGVSGVPLFLNTHPKEFDDIRALTAGLARARERAPELDLVLEVHEGAVTDLSHMKRAREELRALDIGLAYDDFGAGQARLRELIAVPPDYLKFDVDLLEGIEIPDSPANRVVATLTRMLTDLGIRTVAEGVETQATVEACRYIGIELQQGFYHARPQPLEGLSPPL